MPSFKVNSRWAKISKVTDSLFIGGVVAVNPTTIGQNDITCIINATNEVPNFCMNGVAIMKLWVEDTVDTNLLPYFDMVANHIQDVSDGGGRTLVHCLAGVSRSASFCLAYLMKYQKKTLRQAYEYLAARRPVVRPNLSFWKQLAEYEYELYGTNSVKFTKLAGYELPDVYITECDEDAEEDEFGLDSLSLNSSARGSFSGSSISGDSEASDCL